jgi:hypothetical protein
LSERDFNMQTTTSTTWIDNKIYLCKLWPKYKPTPEEGELLNERWGSLKQDILRECIKQHRLERNHVPDLTAIHKAYCKMTQQHGATNDGQVAVQRTQREFASCVPPTDRELQEWDEWAEVVLATATAQEIDRAKARLGVSVNTRRVLAVAVDYCRKHP